MAEALKGNTFESSKTVLSSRGSSGQDGGVGKHGSPPCIITSKLKLNYRLTNTQDHQKLS